MPVIRLPDGSERKFDQAVTVADVAANIGDSLGTTGIRIMLVGSGPVKILRDGRAIDGTWLHEGLDVRAALETLAIVAYRQPITRPGVDAIRGVNSDGVIKSLLSKGLIQEIGRTEGPGRPILYGSTQDFLQHFGLNSLDDLPPFEILEQEGVSQEEQRLLKD